MKPIFKILIAILIIGVLGIGGYFIWRFLASPKPIPELGETVTGAPETLQKPVLLSNDATFDYWINKKTNEIYYLTDDGNIYKISSAGEGEGTGSRATNNLSYIKPSFDGSLILAAFGYPQNPTFAVHNLSTKTWQALPADTTAVAWDPLSNNRLAYLKNTGLAGRLYLYNIDSKKSSEILKINQRDLDLDWITPDLIYLKERPSVQVISSLWSFNLKTKTLQAVMKEESGLIVKWFPSGKAALKFTNSSAKENSLTIVGSSDGPLAIVNSDTLPQKCALATESQIYCAVPRNITKGTTLPDDYLKKQTRFQDDIYLLAFEPNAVLINPIAKIFDSQLSEVPVDADHLEIKEGRLLFINRYDKKLYSLPL